MGQEKWAGDRARVDHLMGEMAAGSTAAMFVFIHEFGGRLAAAVKRHLFEFGRRDVVADADQIQFLVLSAAFAIFGRAAGWDPDGALPWTWADRAIRAEVVRALGHPAVEFDPSVHETRASGDPDCSPVPADGVDDFVALAARDRIVGLLRDAIGEVGSARDQAIHIQYRIQKRLGDASPAHTVATEFGLAPDNVRQIDHRMGRKLRVLVDREERFGALRSLGWLAS